MKRYSDMTIWETKKRIRLLIQFRTNIADYFEATSVSPTFGERHDTDASLNMRPSINLAMQTARNAIDCAGIETQYSYRAAPVAGGYRETIDLILNVFHLGQFQIPPATVIGMIETAIGVYTDEKTAAWMRTLNPFWWLGRVLSWFAAVPFLLIGKAGFDVGRAQESKLGKLTALIFYLIPIVASLLIILDLLGYLDYAKSLLGIGASQ